MTIYSWLTSLKMLSHVISLEIHLTVHKTLLYLLLLLLTWLLENSTLSLPGSQSGCFSLQVRSTAVHFRQVFPVDQNEPPDFLERTFTSNDKHGMICPHPSRHNAEMCRNSSLSWEWIFLSCQNNHQLSSNKCWPKTSPLAKHLSEHWIWNHMYVLCGGFWPHSP